MRFMVFCYAVLKIKAYIGLLLDAKNEIINILQYNIVRVYHAFTIPSLSNSPYLSYFIFDNTMCFSLHSYHYIFVRVQIKENTIKIRKNILKCITKKTMNKCY